jgi:hypothetical protein
MGIFGVSCGSALTLAVANASGKLTDFAWLIKPLFVLGGCSLLYAIITAIVGSRDRTEDYKDAIRNVLHKQGFVSRGELMAEAKLSEANLDKTLTRMRNDGEIHLEESVMTGRTMVRFAIPSGDPSRSRFRAHH